MHQILSQVFYARGETKKLYPLMFVAIIINVLVIFLVLKTSEKIERIIGQNGINITRKIFGVVLLAIAVKLFTSNIKFLL